MDLLTLPPIKSLHQAYIKSMLIVASKLNLRFNNSVTGFKVSI